MRLQKFHKLLLVLHTPLYRKAFLEKKVAASVEHDVLLRNLGKDFKCVIDVGANRGQFALVARKYFQKAKIVSFEPLKEPAAIFRQVFSQDPQVVLHEMALGPEEKEMIFYVSKADDSSSLLPITTLQKKIYPGTEEKEIRLVQVKPLDAVITNSEIVQPALLKIDVQGFELQVLKSCESLIHRFAYCYIECSFIELYSGQALAYQVISWLEIHNFVLSGIYNLSYDNAGKAIQGDFLFTRNFTK